MTIVDLPVGLLTKPEDLGQVIKKRPPHIALRDT